MVLKVGDKEYHIVYTIEASLYSECTERVMMFMQKMFDGSNNKDIHDIISSMSNLPDTTLTMLYAGLLEYHGIEGDNTVPTKNDAKKLLKEYFKEHQEDGTGNFYDLMTMLLTQMGEDGFFRQIGLEQMMEQTEDEETEEKQKDNKVIPIKKRKVGNK